MSNWSKVIICWSGIDDAWHELGKVESVDQRVREILAKVANLRHLHTSYGSPVDGWAVEVVVLCEANHFGPEELEDALRTFPWQYPDEVEVFWKDENDYCYRTPSGRRPGP